MVIKKKSFLTAFVLFNLLLSCSGREERLQGQTKTGVGQTETGATNRKTLSWNAPMTNPDGSPLNDLAGFRIYYGPSKPLNKLDSTHIDVNGGHEIWSFMLPELTGTHYIAVTAIDIYGNESDLSESVTLVN